MQRFFDLFKMGNAEPFRVYNDSDYEVKVEVPQGIACKFSHGDSTRYTIRKREYVCLEQSTLYYIQITVYLLKENGSVCRKCSFNSYYCHSWIVKNEHVYRQESGSALNVVAKDANKYTKELYHGSDRNIMRYTLEEVEIFSRCTCVNIYNQSQRLVRLDVPNGLNTVTGSLKDYKIESTKHVRLENCTMDELEINIRLLKRDGKEFKKCSFKTHKDHSWIVTDDYVYRQKPGSDMKVVADKADDYAEGTYVGSSKNILRYTLKKVDLLHVASNVPYN